MPKVTQPVAAKDHPKFGIVKGQKHYRWVLKTGPRSSQEFRQVAPPRRAQLTTSEFLKAIYDWEDGLSDLADIGDVAEHAAALREIGEEEQGKWDNLPEGFQQGETGQLLEARANACEEAACELESIADRYDFEKPEPNEDGEGDPVSDEGETADEVAERLLGECKDVSVDY